MATEKKTEGVRFDWEKSFQDGLKRLARAKGFEGHNELAREVLKDYVMREYRAATIVLEGTDPFGIARDQPEAPGIVRRRPAI